MYSTFKSLPIRSKALMLGTTVLVTMGALTFSAAAQQTASSSSIEEIVVTGYRKSLADSTDAKRTAINFTDSIFAEDIGKFPDTNLAESLNRIPGIQLTREIDGEGLNIAIRGLGTNFTKILLNGAQTAVASTGRTDSQNTNREVDLDIFPPELFTQLTVSKSPTADLVEGGAAGTVNMRNARPFDNPGSHLSYALRGANGKTRDKVSPSGALIGSTTLESGFGVLLGVSGVRNYVRTDGFETIGWTNPTLSDVQCGAPNATCNTNGGNGFTIPATVPANAGNGLVTGAVIDAALLRTLNPGTTLQQIGDGLIPRLGRPSYEAGTRQRYNGVLALEYRPNDDLHLFMDTLYGNADRNLDRIDMNWVGRNGAAIPINLKVDSNNVVTSGTFANSQWFLEARPYDESLEFYSFNPGLSYNYGDMLKFNVQANYSKSEFRRESPTILVNTPASSGVTVTYDNTQQGGFPTIRTNVDLNNPANFIWNGGRVNVQNEERDTHTKGVHGDVTYGTDDLNLKFGGAYDDVFRDIRAQDNSAAWQAAVCGGNPTPFAPAPNAQPPCDGRAGSLVPQTALATYLKPGPAGFITVDYDKFKAATNYDAFADNAPFSTSSNTAANSGTVGEKTTGLYSQVSGLLGVDEHDLRYTTGVRWYRTKQTITGPISIPNPFNATPVGGVLPVSPNLRPNIIQFITTKNTYDDFLPSGSAVLELSDKAQFRVGLSRTMTRPNPNAMLPGLNFSDPSAAAATRGNPALAPYFSNNIDLGAEYYTGEEGYVGVAVFRKKINGFTVNGTSTVPFTALGIDFNNLTPTQQAALNARGGPNTATVTLTQQVNADGKLTINGLELNWVQPLNFITKGIGFTANLTVIDQFGKGAAPAIAVGVSPYTYNLTGYYENDAVSLRVSWVYNDHQISSGPNQNSVPAASLQTDPYGQLDMAASYNLTNLFPEMPGAPQLTLDAQNLTNAKQRTTFQYDNAAFTVYKPGYRIQLGVRGRF